MGVNCHAMWLGSLVWRRHLASHLRLARGVSPGATTAQRAPSWAELT